MHEAKVYAIRKWMPILAARQAPRYVIYVRSHPAVTRIYSWNRGMSQRQAFLGCRNQLLAAD